MRAPSAIRDTAGGAARVHPVPCSAHPARGMPSEAKRSAAVDLGRTQNSRDGERILTQICGILHVLLYPRLGRLSDLEPRARRIIDP